ncbi:MAG: hypothetical protein ACJAS4_001352 [Bacteriovoracaceae bacterium]|jgi:hypothetical protein
MNVSVIYIGNDLGYWQNLKKGFSQNYQGMNFSFSEIATDNKFSAVETFIDIYESKPQIVYLDLSQESKVGLSLAKLISKNNEMKLISLVGLIDHKDPENMLLKSINASIRLTHIKSNEFLDVIYGPISLLDVNLAEMPTYVRSNIIEEFEIQQPLRVGYIENNRFHVETNSYLEVGDIVSVNEHPLQDIMPSKKVFVEKFYDQDLYYTKRFAYDLEFIYIDDDYFSATNKNWKLYKEYKKNPEKLEELGEVEKEEIKEDMKKRKAFYKPTKEKIDKWMKDRKGKIEPKKLKVMIIDDTLEILKGVKGRVDEFLYSLNFQTFLMGDNYQIQRTMPHLIVYNISEKNTLDVLAEIIEKIKSIEEYNPFVLVQGSQIGTDDLRGKHTYNHLMCVGKEIGVDTIISISHKLNEKHQISQAGEKVFFRYSDKESNIFLKRKVKVLGMTESVMYFQSPIEIPMWTVFRVEKPIKMFLTVVPHKEGGEFSTQENSYRSLINGVGELEKADIRRLINSTLGEEEKD